MTPAEELLCAVIRGEPFPLAVLADEKFQLEFVQASARHGLQPLLYFRLQTASDQENWPAELRGRLAVEWRAHAVREALACHELVRVLTALAGAGVQPLLMKGAALAYSHYPSPSLRPRGDADLLIPENQWLETVRCLQGLGYQQWGKAPSLVTDRLSSYQCAFSKQGSMGMRHALDVHWKI